MAKLHPGPYPGCYVEFDTETLEPDELDELEAELDELEAELDALDTADATEAAT